MARNQITPVDERIIEFLEVPRTANDVAKQYELSFQEAQRRLSRLVRLKQIVRLARSVKNAHAYIAAAAARAAPGQFGHLNSLQGAALLVFRSFVPGQFHTIRDI